MSAPVDEPRPAPEPEEDPRQIATGSTLADISIRNHVFAWILMFALIGFGTLTYTGAGSVLRGLGISQNPDVDFPVVNVSVTYEGASARDHGDRRGRLPRGRRGDRRGRREITSTSRQGQASITIEFELNRPIDAALQDVQTRVAQAARRLPREIDPPIITKSNPEDQPIMWLSLSGDRTPTFLSDYARNVLRPQFQTVPGVGEIGMGGFRERNVRIWYDAARLEAYGLTVLDVNRAVEREHLEVPAGRIETSAREMNVRAEGEAVDLAAFQQAGGGLPQRRPGAARGRGRGRGRAGGPAPHLARHGPALDGLRHPQAARRQRGRGRPRWSRRAWTTCAGSCPRACSSTSTWTAPPSSSRPSTRSSSPCSWRALLTGLVCWLFLGSWSSTVNVLLAIPTSILGTFVVMYFFGFTLNTFTVLGLTLTVGIVVDDAIMVLENIYRHREQGQGKVRAASVGAREITFAAAAATAAIVAIFLPVAFMKGIIGKFFFQFGVTISVAVLISLLEALTLAPMRCSRFLEVGERRGRFGRAVDRTFDRLAAGYRRALGPALRHRGPVLAGAALLFLLSLGAFGLLRTEFVPAQDSSRFQLRFQTPVGSSIDATDQVFRQVEAYLASRPEVHRYFGFIGGFGGGEVNSGLIFVTMKEPGARPRDEKLGRALKQQEFMDVVRRAVNAIPGVRASLQDPSQQGFSASRGFPVEISVRGRDWDTLAERAKAIMEDLRGSGLVTDVDSDYRVGMPEVQVVPDRNRAADLGISMAEIGDSVNAAIGGVRVGKFKDQGRRFDIRGRLLAPQRQRPEDIGRLLVRAGDGSLVRLGDIVRVTQQPTLQAITRRDRERAITIIANVAAGASQTAAIDTPWRRPSASCRTATARAPRAPARRSGSPSSRWASPS